MKMGKKVREYKAGDFIFAKVKGYPAWPARVQRPNGKKYFVYFYGTGETANLPPNMIFDYAENKDKFLSKAVKRRDFNDGVKQIEFDFANNVPLEQVIGVAMEVPDDTANDTANDSAINDTIDESVADTTAAEDTTVADESAVNATARNEPMVEDSDEAGALVIDEGKKGRKSSVKPAPATPKTAKEPKTTRGKKKDEADENKEEEKRDEEIVSRSGRKIRPKRYIDEQPDEITTLPSPAPKKRRGASPTVDKDDKSADAKGKSEKVGGKQLNTVSQSELEDLKEPFTSDDDKENILIAYLPQGQYVGIKLFQSRPASFKNDAARLQWDKQQAQNAVTLKHQLEKGHITSQSVITQLVMDLNLTDEEKATLDKERETEEKRSRVQFLKTEMKLIELEAKIKTCLCLEKADTELCLKLLDEFFDLDVKPLMLLKHPSCGETVKRLRAYVGNAPSWELSESAALLFAKQALRIRRRSDMLYRRVKDLFAVPRGLSFWEYFSERVEQFKKVTAKLSPDELLEMVHEPLEMTLPTSHTMNASVQAANDESADDDSPPKKKTAGKQKKSTSNSTPSKPAVKRQSSRKLAAEKDTESTEQGDREEAGTENAERAEKQSKDVKNTEQDKDKMEVEQSTEKTLNSNEEKKSDGTPQNDNTEKGIVEDNVNSDKDDPGNKSNDNVSDKDTTSKDVSDKVNKTEDDSNNGSKDASEKVVESKDESEKEDKSNDESESLIKSNDESEKVEKSNDDLEKPNKTKDASEKVNKRKDESERVNKTKDESENLNKTKDESEKVNKTKDEAEKGSKTKDDTEKGSRTKDDSEKGKKNKNNSKKENSKSKSPSPNGRDKDENSKGPKEATATDSVKKEAKEDKADKGQKSKEDKAMKEEKTVKAEEKDKDDEPRAKRSRESKKTDAPPPRSPTKRKSKF